MIFQRATTLMLFFCSIFCFLKWIQTFAVIEKPKLKFFTIGTKGHHILDIGQRSFREKGFEVTVLGTTENSTTGNQHPTIHAAFGFKIRLSREYILSDQHGPDDILVYFDGYDSYLSGDPNKFLEEYNKFTKPIVFGACIYNYPDRRAPYPPENKKYEFPYLNAGGFVGKVSAFREILVETDFPDDFDDQRYWTRKYLSRPDLIEIDHLHRLFLAFHGMNRKNFTIIGDQAFYNDAKPIIVHASGGTKSWLSPFIKYAEKKFNLEPH